MITKENPWGMGKSVSKALLVNPAALVQYVEFQMTGRCDGKCITCPSIQQYPDEPTVKSPAILENELNKYKGMFTTLKGMGLELATLYGREPVLWDKEANNKYLHELIRWLSDEQKIRVVLAASGMTLDKQTLDVLFKRDGILFMKQWGSKPAVSQLMKGTNAYERMQQSWALAKDAAKQGAKVIAEFLYTGINRNDLQTFWKESLDSGIMPTVEVPVLTGACANNYKKLGITPEQYVQDIYALSLLNLQLQTGMTPEAARTSDIWQPPYGSLFPSVCDKLSHGKGIFLERNGDMSICSGVPIKIGNIADENIADRIRAHKILNQTRNVYQHLEGQCSSCDYKANCYGCRSKALSNGNLFGEDPMCFGIAALRLGEKLDEIMSPVHASKVRQYFGGSHAA
jgi:radical SAM protein with 4Fe4S-binding SPASM domain